MRDATLDMVLAPRAPLVRDDPAIRFKPIAHLRQIVIARRGHRLDNARSAGALASDEWLCVVRRGATEQALRSLGIPEPKHITECASFSAMLALLARSDMLAVVQHPFLDVPQAAQHVQEIQLAERLPGLTVGLHTRADAPLTRPAAALARLLSDIGRSLLQKT
ncbi:MAG: LysR substrate-binding domain-containing protein [Casimicrobiaceae bacterium]